LQHKTIQKTRAGLNGILGLGVRNHVAEENEPRHVIVDPVNQAKDVLEEVV